MRSTNSASPRYPAASTPPPNDPLGTAAPDGISLPRLYLLRAGYLFVAGGITATQWPLLIHHDPAWPLMDGVKTSMLAAVSVLALLGIRYPLHLLPVLLFELAWKLIWVAAVALPLWASGQLDPATQQVAADCLWVVVVLAVIPWRYVRAQYLAKPGDRWRPSAIRPLPDRP